MKYKQHLGGWANNPGVGMIFLDHFQFYSRFVQEEEMNTKWDVRCSICGRFISRDDIPEKIGQRFTPDTEFTCEDHEFWHKSCVTEDVANKEPQ